MFMYYICHTPERMYWVWGERQEGKRKLGSTSSQGPRTLAVGKIH